MKYYDKQGVLHERDFGCTVNYYRLNLKKVADGYECTTYRDPYNVGYGKNQTEAIISWLGGTPAERAKPKKNAKAFIDSEREYGYKELHEMRKNTSNFWANVVKQFTGNKIKDIEIYDEMGACAKFKINGGEIQSIRFIKIDKLNSIYKGIEIELA